MISNIFQYLEKVKGKPLPLEYKILNNIPLTEDDLTIRGNLYLYNSKIISLPKNLTVNGNLDLTWSKIKQLPNNLTVNGNLWVRYTDISELPHNLYVCDYLWCYGTPLAYKIKNDRSLLFKYSKQVKGRIIHDY